MPAESVRLTMHSALLLEFRCRSPQRNEFLVSFEQQFESRTDNVITAAVDESAVAVGHGESVLIELDRDLPLGSLYS